MGRSRKTDEKIYRELGEHIKTIGLEMNAMRGGGSYDPIKKRFKFTSKHKFRILMQSIILPMEIHQDRD
jgi:hypothetical protein